jgi:hypothetical protein
MYILIRPNYPLKFSNLNNRLLEDKRRPVSAMLLDNAAHYSGIDLWRIEARKISVEDLHGGECLLAVLHNTMLTRINELSMTRINRKVLFNGRNDVLSLAVKSYLV